MSKGLEVTERSVEQCEEIIAGLHQLMRSTEDLYLLLPHVVEVKEMRSNYSKSLEEQYAHLADARRRESARG